MSHKADILLDILPLARKTRGQGTEETCSAEWRLGAFGPTSSISRPIRVFAALARSRMAAPAVRALQNMRSAITGSGARCLPSGRGSATAVRPMKTSAPIAAATPALRTGMTSGPSLRTSERSFCAFESKSCASVTGAVATDAVTPASAVAAAAGPRPLRAALAVRRAVGRPRMSTLTPVTGMAAGSIAARRIVCPAIAGAAPAADPTGARP